MIDSTRTGSVPGSAKRCRKDDTGAQPMKQAILYKPVEPRGKILFEKAWRANDADFAVPVCVGKRSFWFQFDFYHVLLASDLFDRNRDAVRPHSPNSNRQFDVFSRSDLLGNLYVYLTEPHETRGQTGKRHCGIDSPDGCGC